jgi:hypothetical protein
MAKYQDFGYGEDVYGDRVRPEVAVKITNLGYDPEGLNGADVLVQVGPISWDYPGNSRVVVLKSSTYFPPNPDRFAHWTDEGGDLKLVFEDRTPVLVDEELPSGRTFSFRSGDASLGPVAPGTVLYLSVYVSEPLLDPATGDFVKWLPWDYRGRGWKVIPGNYGGIINGMDALPRGVMTGGMIYGEHMMNPQTSFMADVGYVLDTIITDGELMVDTPERIHPNMVLPLLRSFGMGPTEEAFFTDRVVSHRLKHILANYRQITMAKGSYAGLERYVETVTGFPTQVVGPLNLLLDRSDTCPDNPWNIPSNTPADEYSVSAEGGEWTSIPCVGYEENFQSQWPINRLHEWVDVWEDVYDGEGVWFDEWDSFDSSPAMGVLLNPPLIPGVDDPWWDSRFPSPAVGWVHRLQPRSGETLRFGSKKINGQFVPEFAAKATPGQLYQFRFRYYASAPCTISADIGFLDDQGDPLYSENLAVDTVHDGLWDGALFEPVLAPAGSRYVVWSVNVTGDAVVSLGCISLSTGRPYAFRDPRSVAVVMDTGVSTLVSGMVVMDDTTAVMDDPNVTMEARERDPSGESSLDSFERVLIAKLYGTLPAYLPSGVGAQMITSDDPEFSQLWVGEVEYS